MKLFNRVVVVDDHHVVRELFRFQLCRSEPNRYEIVGEGSNGLEAVEVCLQVKPDLLVLDLMLPGLNGLEVMKLLQPQLPDMRVLFFSACARTPLITEALEGGAAGFVGKPRAWSTVLEAVNQVAAGGNYYDSTVAHLIRRDGKEQETEDLALLRASGKSFD